MGASKNLKFRFAVGKHEGPRSGVWRLWTNYAGSDTYVALRISCGVYKVSLHGSGDWRIAHPVESGIIRPDGTRIVERWTRPPEWREGWTRAFEVWVPRSEVVPPLPLLEKLTKVHWTPTPIRVGDPVVVFGVFLSAPDVPLTSEWWPGRQRNDSEVLTKAKLASGEAVWLIRFEHELAEDERASLEKAREWLGLQLVGLADQHGGVGVVARSLVPFQQVDPQEGSINRLIEMVVQVFKGLDVASELFSTRGTTDWWNADTNQGLDDEEYVRRLWS
jgi:hypothetical protein